MAEASKARQWARAALGEPWPDKQPGEDADGVDRVAAAESRADKRPSGFFCEECGLEFELGYRPDPCIGGYLPDVSHACCGHGRDGQAYVTIGGVPDQAAHTIVDRLSLRGRAAADYIEQHRHLATPDPLTTHAQTC